MAAAAAITVNYEIGHHLKSKQLRDPLTHVFKGKECNEAIICVLRSQQLPQNSTWPSKLAFLDLFARGYTFFTLIFSSHRNRELVELLWELQIDVSIIYQFLFDMCIRCTVVRLPGEITVLDAISSLSGRDLL